MSGDSLKDNSSVTQKNSQVQLGFVCNANECSGCKACVIACKDIHNLAPGKKFRRVLSGESGTWIEKDSVVSPAGVFSYSFSISCNHCSKPVCAMACPRKAITKSHDTGIVQIDESLCIGCGKCVKVCPYHAPVVFKEVRKTYKCDMCFDRLQEGKEPACVAACTMRSLKVGEIVSLREEYGSNSDDALLPDSHKTLPNFVLVPHRFCTEDCGEVVLSSMPEEYENT